MTALIELEDLPTYSANSFPGAVPEPDPDPSPEPDPDPVIPMPGNPGIDPGFPLEPTPEPAPLT